MKKTYFWLAVAAVAFIGGLYFVYQLTTKAQPAASQEIEFYQMSDTSRPKLKTLGKNPLDLGNMKVSDERSATFTIQNQGDKPLQIFYGATNCGCTFGQVKKGDYQSPVFGMHPSTDFYLALAPQEKAEVEVVYKPYLMPVSGKVQRAATLKTNDPENPEMSFVVKAFVE